MNAALLEAISPPLVLRDVPTPQVAADEVLVQILACGICGTALRILERHEYHILGYEPGGVIAGVGAALRHVVVGNRIVPRLFCTCNACYYCWLGGHLQCAHLD